MGQRHLFLSLWEPRPSSVPPVPEPIGGCDAGAQLAVCAPAPSYPGEELEQTVSFGRSEVHTPSVNVVGVIGEVFFMQSLC